MEESSTLESMFADSIPPHEEKKQKKKRKKKLPQKRKREKPKKSDEPKRKKRKFSDVKKLESEERQNRTIRVENIPFKGEKLAKHKKKLKNIFKKYGKIESIRFRNVPVERTRNNLPIDVCVKKGFFREGNMTSFIVFEKIESAEKSVSEQNEGTYNNQKIFVSRSNTSISIEEENELDSRKLFLGNLPFDITDDELRTIFSEKEKLINGKLTDIFFLRDKKTKQKKGCAIVTFDSEGTVQNIFKKKLKINFKGFRFRFKKFIGKNTKPKKKKKKKKKSENFEEKSVENKNENENEWWMGKKSSKKNKIKVNINKKRKKKKKKKEDDLLSFI